MKILVAFLMLLLMNGCGVEYSDIDMVHKTLDEEIEDSTIRFVDGEWIMSHDLEIKIVEALGESPHEANEEALYNVLSKDDRLRDQYLTELYEVLDHKVKIGVITIDEANAQKETMEFIFDEKQP
ncbi:hypothetical protein [Halobacillus campisalis]|uniref:Uncharacterized protein n=1 Tax=Halobacillus campisalis TaxID=435909 RepID=A0ABW2K6K8_9BACI|nr:hypothetical protein [Halobacillus campisalis]